MGHATTYRMSAANNIEVTELLLVCGVMAGALLIGVTLIQASLRPGFLITRQPTGLLMLGDLGWIQRFNFLLTGALTVACACGMWRLLHPGFAGTVAPLLTGIYGLGLLGAGSFPPDPQLGFPAGAPAGVVFPGSWHGLVHVAALLFGPLAVAVGSADVARRFAEQEFLGWMAYGVATALGIPFLTIMGIAMAPSGHGGLPLFAVQAASAAWVALTAKRLLHESAYLV